LRCFGFELQAEAFLSTGVAPMIAETKITKDDVPYCLRPAYFTTLVLLLLCLYVATLVVEPRMNPGIVEALIGLALATTAERLFRDHWITYLTEVTEACVKRPDVKYLACIRNGPFYTKNFGLYLGVQVTVLFGGFIVTAALSPLVKAATSVYPPLVALTTRQLSSSSMASWLPMLAVYFGTLLVIVYRLTLRWYKGLCVQR
jgi:hypothetical protein